MEKTVARILSIIFHPLLVPSFFLLLLFHLPFYDQMSIPLHIRSMILLFVFLITFVLPAVIASGMWLLKLIDSLEMHKRHERMLPMIIIAIFYYITFYSLKELDIFKPAAIFMLGSTVLILIGLVFNYFYKISQHMIAWGGFSGAIIALEFSLHTPLYFWLFCILIASGITGYARLKAEAHTPFEVYSGWLLGVAVMTTIMLTL